MVVVLLVQVNRKSHDTGGTIVRLLSKGPRWSRTSWLQPMVLRWLVKSELNSVTACNAHKVRRCGYTTCCNNPCCWRRRAKTESFYKHSQYACAAQRGKTEHCGSPGGRQAAPALLLGPLLARERFLLACMLCLCIQGHHRPNWDGTCYVLQTGHLGRHAVVLEHDDSIG